MARVRRLWPNRDTWPSYSAAGPPFRSAFFRHRHGFMSGVVGVINERQYIQRLCLRNGTFPVSSAFHYQCRNLRHAASCRKHRLASTAQATRGQWLRNRQMTLCPKNDNKAQYGDKGFGFIGIRFVEDKIGTS